MRVVVPEVGEVVADRMVHQALQPLGVAVIGAALEGADADVGMGEAHQHGGARRRGLVVALEFLAGLDQREALRGVDPLRLQHGGGQHLAHAALQRQPSVRRARPRGLAAALGGEVEQASVQQVVQLREQEAAPVAEIGVVRAELVAVVAQRQRRLQRAGQRDEAAEMVDPCLVRQPVEPHPSRPFLVAVAQDVLREPRRRDLVEELGAEIGMGGGGAVGHGNSGIRRAGGRSPAPAAAAPRRSAWP